MLEYSCATFFQQFYEGLSGCVFESCLEQCKKGYGHVKGKSGYPTRTTQNSSQEKHLHHR